VEERRQGLFYGWWIVVAGLVITTITLGAHMSFGVFFKPIQAEFDWTRAATATGFFMGGLAIATLALTSGALTDRYGPRMVITGVGLVNGLGYLLVSQIDSRWQFYLVFPLMASGMSTLTPIMATVSRWFTARRGLALGVAGIGAGLGQAVMPPVASYLVSHFGWRYAYIILAALVGIIVVSAAQVVRRDPRGKGLLPYSEGEHSKPLWGTSLPGGGGEAAPLALSLPQAVHSRAFWMVLVAGALGSVTMQMTFIHLVPYVTDIGLSAAVGATLLALIGLTNMMGKLVTGWLCDRIGAQATLTITNALTGMVMLWLLVADEGWMLYGFAIAFGLVSGGWMTMLAATAGELFGVGSLGAVFGAMQAGTATAGTAGTILGGYIYDVTRSYFLAFLLGAVLYFIAAALVAGAKGPQRSSHLG
jgi:MFS family permease